MLEKAGYNIKIESEILRVNKGSLTIIKRVIKNGLYLLAGRTIMGEASFIQD